MIKEILDSVDWNNLVKQCQPHTFLHAWEWGQVQKAAGDDVKYLGLISSAPGAELVGLALVISVNARRGRHYLIPHGPLFLSPKIDAKPGFQEQLSEIVNFLKSAAKQDRVVALRVAPLVASSMSSQQIFIQLGFRPSPLHLHAELTWVLNLDRSPGELMSDMRKTTRHAIMKAYKVGVTTEIITAPDEALHRFWPLYENTRQRHSFILWPKNVVRSQLEIFGRSDLIYSAIARYNNHDVAAAILPHFGDTVYYYHGASIKLPGSVPAAQLLQWAAIQEAQRRGAIKYNFWGISPADKPKHPFAGITTFKKGFGGYAISYLRTQDLSLNYRYWKLWSVDTYRKFKRGFYA